MLACITRVIFAYILLLKLKSTGIAVAPPVPQPVTSSVKPAAVNARAPNPRPSVAFELGLNIIVPGAAFFIVG